MKDDISIQISSADRSVDCPWLAPAGTEQLRSCKAQQAGEVAAGGEGDEAPILSAASGEDLASDGDSSESTYVRNLRQHTSFFFSLSEGGLTQSSRSYMLSRSTFHSAPSCKVVLRRLASD